MTTILHASGAAELLSAIPVLTGFAPRRSVVLLPFAGSRAGSALRFDAPSPPSLDSADVEAVAATAVGLACRVPDTDAIAIAVFTDDALTPGAVPDGTLPGTPIAEQIIRRARACGLRIVEALCVGAEGWADYLDPLAAVRANDALPPTPEVPGLAGIGADQRSGAHLPSADRAERHQVAQALRELERAVDAGPPRAGGRRGAKVDPRAFAAMLSLDDLPAVLDDALETPESRPPFVSATLIWVLARPVFRDVALVQWTRGGEAGSVALDAQLAASAGRAPISASPGDVFLGRGPRPDPDRLGIALLLTRNLAALAPRATRPGVLATAAWLAWALGRSTHTAHYLDLAAAIDPEHSLCRILRATIDAGILPEWAFQRAGTNEAGSPT